MAVHSILQVLDDAGNLMILTLLDLSSAFDIMSCDIPMSGHLVKLNTTKMSGFEVSYCIVLYCIEIFKVA